MTRTDGIDQVWEERGVKAYANFTDHPVRTTLLWVGGFIAFLLVLSVIGNIVGIANVYWGAEQAKLTVHPRVQQYTYGTDNAIVNIAYFHNQCNTVLADRTNVANAEAQLKQDRATLASTTDVIAQQQAGTAVTQDISTLTGTRDQLANDVRDYNAKSATSTSSPFKEHGLPYRLNLSPNGDLAGNPSCG